MAAALAMLDESHDSLPKNQRDHNSSTLGRIGPRNIVIACLPEGVTSKVNQLSAVDVGRL
jgi:hypothetical protein